MVRPVKNCASGCRPVQKKTAVPNIIIASINSLFLSTTLADVYNMVAMLMLTLTTIPLLAPRSFTDRDIMHKHKLKKIIAGGTEVFLR